MAAVCEEGQPDRRHTEVGVMQRIQRQTRAVGVAVVVFVALGLVPTAAQETGNYNQFWLADRNFDHDRTSLVIVRPMGRFPRAHQMPNASGEECRRRSLRQQPIHGQTGR